MKRKTYFYKNKIKRFLSHILMSTFKNRIPKINKNSIDKILIYAFTGLGNFIMYTPAILTIKKLFPDAKLTLLYSGDTSCDKVLKGTKIIDNYLLSSRKKNLLKTIISICKTRKKNYDLVISEFHNTQILLILLTIFGNFKYKIGHVTTPDWSNIWSFVYNIPVKMKKNQHEIDRYMEIAYKLGASIEKKIPEPYININSSELNFAETFVKKSCNIKDKFLISAQICIKYSISRKKLTEHKAWDINKYLSIINILQKKFNAKVVIHGTKKEYSYIKDKIAQIKPTPILAAGKTTIKQAAAIIKYSDLFIGNDSGLMHVAKAVDTPIIAIYGPTDYKRTAPKGEKNIIIRKQLSCSPCWKMGKPIKMFHCPHNYRCLKEIEVKDVLPVIEKKIEKIEKIKKRKLYDVD